MSNPKQAFGVRLGDRIELVHMGADPAPIVPGTRGTVDHLCDSLGLEQIGVKWDNGRHLNLIPGVDSWKVI